MNSIVLQIIVVLSLRFFSVVLNLQNSAEQEQYVNEGAFFMIQHTWTGEKTLQVWKASVWKVSIIYHLRSHRHKHWVDPKYFYTFNILSLPLLILLKTSIANTTLPTWEWHLLIITSKIWHVRFRKPPGPNQLVRMFSFLHCNFFCDGVFKWRVTT